MIESVSVIPVHNDRGDLKRKKLTGLGIFIKCNLNNAEDIFKMLGKIDRRELETPKEEVHPPRELYFDGIDVIKYFTESTDEVRTFCQLYGHWDPLNPEMDAKLWEGICQEVGEKTMSKGTEEKLTYADWGYIPATDLTQDEIDKVKKMAERLNSAESEEEVKND